MDHATKIHTGQRIMQQRFIRASSARDFCSLHRIGPRNLVPIHTVPGRRMEVCNSQSIDNIKKMHELKILPAADAGGASV